MRIPQGFCQCGCGQKTSFARDGSRKKFIKSHNKGPVTHGLHDSSEYQAWRNMKARCADPQSYCGVKGIKVCDRWLESFENFIADMGRKPRKNLYLDRENNDGNYEPGNCRWTTPHKSALNRDNKKTEEVRKKISESGKRTRLLKKQIHSTEPLQNYSLIP